MAARSSISTGSARQRGLSLFFAMMALVAIALATVALVRAVDTGTLIVGNLSFKQSATVVAGRGAEAAIAWLESQGGTSLYFDSPANGYYAASMETMDPTNGGKIAQELGVEKPALVDWDHDGCAYADPTTYTTCLAPSPQVKVGDHTLNYIITRLCRTTGDHQAAGNYCAMPVQASTDSASPSRGELKYGEKRFEFPPGPFYRIVVRALGARHTSSYTETVVHF